MSGGGQVSADGKPQVVGRIDEAILKNFDKHSGNWLERLIFNHRWQFALLCVLVTILLGSQAVQLHLSASFNATLPQSSPYIQNYLKYKSQVPELGNLIRVVLETTHGTIYTAGYQKELEKVYNTLYSVPGIEQVGLESLWAPTVRYSEVTPDGFVGGPVMPNNYDGSKESLEKLRHHVEAAHLRGRLVGLDLKSSMLVAPLLDINPKTGGPLNYQTLSHDIEHQIRDTLPKGYTLHVVGFAKLQGDLMDGVGRVLGYFIISILITGLIVFLYTRCIRSTLMLVLSSFIAVIWELGLIRLLGYSLDPYSVLVPFLVFAIGISHGSQKMNGIMQDIGRGASSYVAARFTFRRLFMAGLTALLADAVGFIVIMVIDIPVIRALALTASLGVLVLIFTNLLLLPVMLSYAGVSKQAAARSLRAEENYGKDIGANRVWNLLQKLTTARWGGVAIACGAILLGVGWFTSEHLQTGALTPGASALWPNSQYNRDNAYITGHYGLSSNQFAVLVKTPDGDCSKYSTLIGLDRLGWTLRQLPGVMYTDSLARRVRLSVSGSFEGNPKWLTLVDNKSILEPLTYQITANGSTVSNRNCSVSPVIAYLTDHKAATLARTLGAVEAFAKTHDNKDIQFLPVAGSAGVQAVTDRAVKHASATMMYYVYAAVILLCLIAFRSWRAALVALIPLFITAKLCEALMVVLGIGVEVSTLPVIALGVGIGVDYALYLLSIQLAAQRMGLPLKDAYRLALHFTGKVVALVGITLAAGVVTWAWSPIRFQAHMGILLMFMFLWNMIGALLLIPALSRFLLFKVKPSTFGRESLI
ncbi:MAG TPA: MMPL family transporter [Nevskiaceae bacterium]|nr:MMPL family transporter [Nevskiaceae bacterium]